MLIETGQLNLDVEDDVGRTPLWWAAAVGNDEAMKLMLRTGQVGQDIGVSTRRWRQYI
jgi:ankyrin repeat protein